MGQFIDYKETINKTSNESFLYIPILGFDDENCFLWEYPGTVSDLILDWRGASPYEKGERKVLIDKDCPPCTTLIGEWRVSLFYESPGFEDFAEFCRRSNIWIDASQDDDILFVNGEAIKVSEEILLMKEKERLRKLRLEHEKAFPASAYQGKGA
jgi:hypothetical protein